MFYTEPANFAAWIHKQRVLQITVMIIKCCVTDASNPHVTKHSKNLSRCSPLKRIAKECKMVPAGVSLMQG